MSEFLTSKSHLRFHFYAPLAVNSERFRLVSANSTSSSQPSDWEQPDNHASEKGHGHWPYPRKRPRFWSRTGVIAILTSALAPKAGVYFKSLDVR